MHNLLTARPRSQSASPMIHRVRDLAMALRRGPLTTPEIAVILNDDRDQRCTRGRLHDEYVRRVLRPLLDAGVVVKVGTQCNDNGRYLNVYASRSARSKEMNQ